MAAAASAFGGMSRRFLHTSRQLYNTNDAFITKAKRSVYVRTYPTTVVQPDGSTFTIRYHEPRQIIQLPLRFEELSATEKQIVLAKRRPKEVYQKADAVTVKFDSSKYLKYVSSSASREKNKK